MALKLLWETLRAGEYQVDIQRAESEGQVGQMTIISLDKDETWLEFHFDPANRLFARQCYLDLYDIVMAERVVPHQAVLLSGHPGIGLFEWFLLSDVNLQANPGFWHIVFTVW